MNLWSIDPGMSTGLALFEYDDTQPLGLVDCWQIPGGLSGFMQWEQKQEGPYAEDTIITEKFQPISHSNYALTTASVEPLLIEGALVWDNFMPWFDPNAKKNDPRWRRPAVQYFAGGKTKQEKKKRQHAWLKDHGFYVTGKMVGAPDADDVRSAMAHAVAYMREIRHTPTLEAYFREGQ